MKKVLVSLLVLAICAPAMADVTISGEDMGDGQLKITIAPTGGAAVRGVALKLTTTSGDAVIDGTDDATVSGMNTNIDYYVDNVIADVDENDVPDDAGHPLANPADAGVLDLSTPKSMFSLSSGYLDGTGGKAGYAVDSFFDVYYTITVQSVVSIELDTLRGGIVGDDLGTVTITTPTVTLNPPPTECISSSASFYQDWLDFGSPDCWCYARNCLGDVDGLKEGNILQGYAYVYNDDLTTFLLAYGVREPTKGPGILSIPNGICADFARDEEGNILQGYARVYNNDLTILLASYGVREPTKGPGIGDCTGPDYNFFVDPE